METICITLPTFGSAVTVNLDRKKMKTCRLKVYPNQKIVLSLPQSAPDAWAESFLMEKSGWIESKLQSFQKTVGYAATKEIRNGYSIRMLGEDMIFALSQCEKECVYAEGKKIRICCKSPEDQTHVKQLFEAWWRRQAKEILQERVHVWYPIVEKYGVAMPELSIRKMKTLWGSCSVARHVITFIEEGNHYLMTKEEIENKIATYTGGRAAEETIFGTVSTGAYNDIEQATKLARAMITRYGMSDNFDMVAMETVTNQYLGGDTSLACSPEMQAEIDRQVISLIKRQHEKALKILQDNRSKLDELAKFLYEKETITGEEFMQILHA